MLYRGDGLDRSDYGSKICKSETVLSISRIPRPTSTVHSEYRYVHGTCTVQVQCSYWVYQYSVSTSTQEMTVQVVYNRTSVAVLATVGFPPYRYIVQVFYLYGERVQVRTSKLAVTLPVRPNNLTVLVQVHYIVWRKYRIFVVNKSYEYSVFSTNTYWYQLSRESVVFNILYQNKVYL